MASAHSFHIPVMGIGFTIDTPLKVAPFGIDSVISLVDDILVEKMRKMYCAKFNMPYTEITEKNEDFRAERITKYLNMIQSLAEKKFEELKSATNEKIGEVKDFFHFLPDNLSLKKEFYALTAKHFNADEVRVWLKDKLTMGSIDVNIMTKVDKDNYRKKEKLPTEYNDAHAALRGYANSNLSSSLVLSAGMNPRLYSYIEKFEDFFPNENGEIKKKIILKVSDYRSALIQGKFLAKKGIWISEYRIESGLNCGGHAFATEGFLMGPILAEFRDKRQELIDELHNILLPILEQKGKAIPAEKLALKISAQGGVGTALEHEFLLDHYQVDSVGWGTPFLLVPEATSVDKKTLELLEIAKEKDLYLSDISPLGVPFNSLRGNTKEEEKQKNIEKGRPGSACPKRFVALNKEYKETGVCTASREYQHLKIKELASEELSAEAYKKRYNKIVVKSCTCVGLGTSALLVNNLDTKVEGTGVSVCPGPNMAYFDKVLKLREMIDHIYGRANVVSRTDRPNMFVKEIQVYLDYLADKFDEAKDEMNAKQEKYFASFAHNLNEGILYYKTLFSEVKSSIIHQKEKILFDLEKCEFRLNVQRAKIDSIQVLA